LHHVLSEPPCSMRGSTLDTAVEVLLQKSEVSPSICDFCPALNLSLFYIRVCS
jgi:hypothetical protein